jgi:DNA-binding response OmpR family regulator
VVARVRAVLRRVHGGSGSLLRAGDLVVDLNGHRAWLGDEALSLTQSEFQILSLLVEHHGQVLSRPQLLQVTHGVSDEELARTVDQHVKNLRRKLRDIVGEMPVIHTIYGVGYRLDEVHLSHA